MVEVTEIIKLFKEKPYLIKMGAGKIGRMYDVSPDNVRKARGVLRKSMEVSNTTLEKIKILILDIETAPLKAYVWSRWKQNIYLDQTISEWFMICWAAKWLGEDDVMGDVLSPEEILEEDDERITKRLWGLLDECNIVIAHNGNYFDIPKINSRFIVHGMPPPSPYKQIDTRTVASRQFGFSSNKLDALAGYFNIEHKDDTDFQLWVDCMNGSQKALNYMMKYNLKDVRILEKVYLRLRPWIKNHPNVGIYLEEDHLVCPSCGGTHMVEDGSSYFTNVNKYKMYRCEGCGAVSRARRSSYPKEKKDNLLISTP